MSKFERLIDLSGTDYNLLTPDEKQELDGLRLQNPRGDFSYVNGPAIVIFIGVVVLLYSWAGGLLAAYLTDFVQGIFIIILSFILIPFGCTR